MNKLFQLENFLPVFIILLQFSFSSHENFKMIIKINQIVMTVIHLVQTPVHQVLTAISCLKHNLTFFFLPRFQINFSTFP